ncbi:hypothetical protein Nepgr_033286 [Nepenthes gracilis]|uniref:Pentatricopeptide repeat-containing protein n=1 Tax=Nepenthes gracilis TaxID=150966 RepID=A0AAD3TKC0_NEPGR|nr:hypothetical protein Nepgr_033286 [Nepenthes gracilis]
MNAANSLSFLLGLNSIFSTGRPRAHWLCNQVIQFSNFFQPPSASFPEQLHIYNLFNTHQKLFFSSKPMPMVKLRLPSDWSKHIQKEIEKLNPNLAHEISIFILRKLDRDPQKALDFFNWVCGRKGFQPSSLLYSSLLRILVGKDWMKQFWVTIREMNEKGLYIGEETYLTILGLLKKERMASDVAALTHFYNRMIQENAMNDAVRNAVEVILGATLESGT